MGAVGNKSDIYEEFWFKKQDVLSMWLNIFSQVFKGTALDMITTVRRNPAHLPMPMENAINHVMKKLNQEKSSFANCS